ncbi:MAG: hypothetical protein WCZ02_06765, partial [Lysobacterales bacterium]
MRRGNLRGNESPPSGRSGDQKKSPNQPVGGSLSLLHPWPTVRSCQDSKQDQQRDGNAEYPKQ